MDLTVIAGKAAGTTVSVTDQLVIGRVAGGPGDLGGDPALSREHARLVVTGAGLMIEDLGSSNGTFVNGERISRERLLKPGDVVQVGDSKLQFGQKPPPTLAGQPALGDHAAAAATGAGAGQERKLDPRIPVLAVLCVLFAVVAAVAFATGGDDSDDQAAAPAPAAAGDAAGWLYAISNSAEGNGVLAVDRRDDGSLGPVHVREFPTGGDGAALIPGESLGALAGDSQVTVSEDQRLLFAVNQGSDTVSVFRVDRSTGALEPVSGSPFPSGGKAPVTTGFNGRHLVVVNKGIIPGEEIPGDPQNTNYASFAVSENGALEPVNAVPAPGSGPTAALFAPNGRVVFGAEFYAFALDVFTIGQNGTLERAPGMPAQFPDSITRGRRPPPGESPDMLKLPYGVAVHPTLPFVYYLAAASDRVAVYRYDEQTGEVEFVSQADNPDTIASCWARITSDGRFLYTGNSGSLDITAYRVSEDGDELTRIELQESQSQSTIANIAFDESERFLYALGTSDSPDFPLGERAAPANTLESFAIGDDGSLEPIDSVALPLPITTFPAGLAVVERDG